MFFSVLIMKSFSSFITEKKSISKEFAKKVGDELNVNWNDIDLEQLRKGMEVEQEHDDSSETDVIPGSHDFHKIAKVALAHLKELPDYYDRLAKMEK